MLSPHFCQQSPRFRWLNHPLWWCPPHFYALHVHVFLFNLTFGLCLILVQSHLLRVFSHRKSDFYPKECHALNYWWIHRLFAASKLPTSEPTPFPNLLKADCHDAWVLQHGPINGHLIKCYLASAIPARPARLRVMGRSPAAPRVPRWSPCRWPKSKKAALVGSVGGWMWGWSDRDLIGKSP